MARGKGKAGEGMKAMSAIYIISIVFGITAIVLGWTQIVQIQLIADHEARLHAIEMRVK